MHDHDEAKTTYLVSDAIPLGNIVQHSAQPCTIVGSIHLGEAQDGPAQPPISWGDFFNPMACNGEVRITITCLPGITGERDLPRNPIAL